MVDLEVYFRESNAIEDVHSEAAVEEMRDAWEFLASQSILTHETVQTAHERMLRNRQPEIAGSYRTTQVSIGGRLPPQPVVIEPLVGELLDWSPSDPLEALTWHIAFEQIHPFADGNGRIGRLLYLWHCREQLNVEPILWRASDREGYYALFDSQIEGFEQV